MNKYRVGVFEEQGGYMEITARDVTQARRKAEDFISTYGLSHERIDITHRDTSIVDGPTLITEGD